MVEFISIVIYVSIYLGLVATTFYILSYLDYHKKPRKFFLDSELPKVTVVIPAYNEGKSIAGTIETISKSDYPRSKFEIIVVDDGSKDDTYDVAKKYDGKYVRVFRKKNGGKGSALNFGIARAKGEIIIGMDADSFVEPQSMKNMMHYFTNPRVMAVTPAMIVYKPKNIWQRIQYMEYFLGLFLRKAFATLNAVYIAPGAFSAYRKSFFDKYGGYDENTITEDIELSLRVQYHGYFVENCPDAPVHTITPSNFLSLLIQRRRWYFGYIKNVWRYREIISNRKYGDLGLFIIPLGIISIALAVFVALYLFFKSITRVLDEITFLKSLDYHLSGVFDFNSYFFERFFFLLFTNPLFLSILFFGAIMGFYIYWASKRVGKTSGLAVNLVLFLVCFAILFGFWWSVSIVYSIFAKNVKWR